MSNFFDSEIIQEELIEINKLQEEVYGKILNVMHLTPEEQAELQRQELSQELYGNEQNDLANVGNTEQQWSRPQTQQINYLKASLLLNQL